MVESTELPQNDAEAVPINDLRHSLFRRFCRRLLVRCSCGFVTYGSQITGQDFGFIYNGASESQRKKTIRGWRDFFAEQTNIEVLRWQVISIAGKSDTSPPKRYRQLGIRQFPHDDKATQYKRG